MAKCSICNVRKGKRKCLATNTFICSPCCGEFRKSDKCSECSFYRDEKTNRNYLKVPSFELQKMADDIGIQNKANVIESAICQFDEDHNRNINDNIALRLIELLIDKYYFNDNNFIFKDALEENGFNLVDNAIKSDIKDISGEEISKIIGTIYRSIKRRTGGRREYINFIQQYVGIRLGKGLRAISDISHIISNE